MSHIAVLSVQDKCTEYWQRPCEAKGVSMEYRVPAVERAIAMLEYLNEGGSIKRSLAEICDSLEMPRSSGLNIVRTLEAHGFLQRDPGSGKYGLGWALVRLGLGAAHTNRAEEALLHPTLDQLAKETLLTSLLGRVLDEAIMIVDIVEGSRTPRATTSLGHLDPLQAGAPGKAALAFRPVEAVREYLARRGLPAYTNATITDMDVMLRELALIRERGYATSYGEYNEGVSSMASPVFNAQGDVAFCVFVLSLGDLPSKGNSGDVAVLVKIAAQRMTVALGGVWPSEGNPESSGSMPVAME